METTRTPLMGLAALMRRAFNQEQFSGLGAELIARSEANPDDAEALMDLSTVLHIMGRPEVALAVQAQALAMQSLYRLSAATGQANFRLLALMSPGDLSANMPLEALLEQSDVELDMLYLLPGQPLPAEPEGYDAVLVAMSESGDNRAILQALITHLASWKTPVLNKPERLLYMSRDWASKLMYRAPGLEMPIVYRMHRDHLLPELDKPDFASDTQAHFPLIIRPMDSHAGHGLTKVDTVPELKAYVEQSPAEIFYVSSFYDYRSPDGLYRKYRVVMIDGKPYAGHMAISSDWMIHYLNAGMADSPEKRVEEEAFMVNFDTYFARRHRVALGALQKRLKLDYFGIDCAETKEGELLVFEVDHAMIVHAMDSTEVYPYKQEHMAKVFTAFRALLERSRNQA